MSRENLRPIFRRMPLWLLRILFVVLIFVILVPVAIWDALRNLVLMIRYDWRELHDRFTDAAASGAVRPHIGQIMAECDCARTDECSAAGRCLALDVEE